MQTILQHIKPFGGEAGIKSKPLKIPEILLLENCLFLHFTMEDIKKIGNRQWDLKLFML